MLSTNHCNEMLLTDDVHEIESEQNQINSEDGFRKTSAEMTAHGKCEN